MIKKIRIFMTYLLLVTIIMTILPNKIVCAKTNDDIGIEESQYIITSKLSNKSI